MIQASAWTALRTAYIPSNSCIQANTRKNIRANKSCAKYSSSGQPASAVQLFCALYAITTRAWNVYLVVLSVADTHLLVFISLQKKWNTFPSQKTGFWIGKTENSDSLLSLPFFSVYALVDWHKLFQFVVAAAACTVVYWCGLRAQIAKHAQHCTALEGPIHLQQFGLAWEEE